MDKQTIKNHFLDYLEGQLSPADLAQFESLLKASPDLKQALENYQELIRLEKHLAHTDFQLGNNFSVEVMEKLDQTTKPITRRLAQYMTSIKKRILVPVATCTVIALVFVLTKDNGLLLNNNIYQKAEPKSAAQTGHAEPAIPIVVALSEETKAATSSSESASPNNKHVAPIEAQLTKETNASVPSRETTTTTTTTDSRQQVIPTQEEEVGALRDSAAGANLVPSPVQFDFQNTRTEHPLKNTASEKRARTQIAANEASHIPSRSDKTSVHFRELGSPVEPNTIMPYPGRSIEDTEQYGTYAENPRMSTATEQVSTFSLDVDTASYTNARRYLQLGQLPPKDSIRIEEFINYFDYDYKKQTTEPFAVQYEVAPSPLEPDRFLLKLGVRARDAVQNNEKGWNLVFLIDTSGSMNEPDKLPLLKQCLKLVVEQMRPIDKIAIVTYAGNAGLALDSTSGSEKQKLNSVLDSLGAGGSTHGSAGIDLAYEVATRNLISGSVNRVILATDGDFNVGTYSFDGLKNMIEEKRKSGITLTTLGFGTGNLHDQNLEQLADKGNGNYFYIDSYQEARKVMQTQLTANMQVVAKDVKVQVEFNPAAVAQYRLIGYDNRKLSREDFNNDAVDAGEIGSGHTVTVLYEIILKGSELGNKLNDELRYKQATVQKMPELTSDKSELAFIKVRYKEPEAASSNLLTFPVKSEHKLANADQASDDFRFASAVSYFGHLLRSSNYKGSYTHSQIADLAQKAKGLDSDGYRQEFINLVRNAATSAIERW